MGPKSKFDICWVYFQREFTQEGEGTSVGAGSSKAGIRESMVLLLLLLLLRHGLFILWCICSSVCVEKPDTIIIIICCCWLDFVVAVCCLSICVHRAEKKFDKNCVCF